MLKEQFNISDELKGITNKYIKFLKETSEFDLGFNLFSLISDTYYKENFHSEIISEILKPKGKHNAGPKHLDTFIDLLKSYKDVKIEKSNYQNAEVESQYPTKDGRKIDILIFSNSHSIIIENKMHNAKDQYNQIVDYYLECKNNLDLEVDLILYLTMDGIKRPDISQWECDENIKSEIINKILPLAAYTSYQGEQSLFHWLEKCQIEPSISDSYFVVNQYQKLLKSLAKSIMDPNELKEYFEYLNKNQDQRKEIEKLLLTHKNLIYYYPIRLQQEIKHDSNLSSCYTDSKIYDGSALLFYNIFKDEHYYLKVTFFDDKLCEIIIKDNQRIYKNQEYLEKEPEFRGLFDAVGPEWIFKRKEYNLLSEFDKLVSDVEKILKLTKSIGEEWDK